jgi:hypothetical protein
MTRFPDQHFSVACLCNLGTIDPRPLANRIADIYLADQFNEAGGFTSTQAEPKREATAPVKFIELTEPELKEKTLENGSE